MAHYCTQCGEDIIDDHYITWEDGSLYHIICFDAQIGNFDTTCEDETEDEKRGYLPIRDGQADID